MEETPTPKFLVHLQQHEWITTESFEFEAATKEDALALAQKLVDDKELTVEYRLTALEVELPKPVVNEPAEVNTVENVGEPLITEEQINE